MPAYVVLKQMVDDPAVFKAYQHAIQPVIEQFGGKFIVHGSRPSVTLEGPVESRRIVILEFPNLSDAQACYESAELADVRKLHEEIGNVECIAIEGDG